jgi:dienelactone hydrolase
MKIALILLPPLLINAIGVRFDGQTSTWPHTVVVSSDSLQLRALIWLPEGRGPFPAILFCHGSGPTDPSRAQIIGPVFARHGYVFLYLFRRGDGLSASQGTFIGDLLQRERETKGDDAANQLQVRLLETDHLDDALAGLDYLRALPVVDARRLGVVGHSFGGSLTLLLAERDKSLRSAVDFAGGAVSWQRSSYLRKRLISAVRRLTTPIFFIHAANDFSITPGEVLNREMARLGKAHKVKVYPAVGQTADEGHNFIYLAIGNWEHDLFAFLDKHMKDQSRRAQPNNDMHRSRRAIHMISRDAARRPGDVER